MNTAAAPLLPEPDDADAPLVVAVRTLCHFTARCGDLDHRFTPSPSGAEGIAGHQTVTARRPPGYQREVPLSARCGPLTVQGRADGFDPAAMRLEEIKTHRGDAGQMTPEHRALHWAQAKVYGWMLCEQRGLGTIELALVYFNIDTGEETVFTQSADAATLERFFTDLCQRYRAWAQSERAHRRTRDAALATLAFPFEHFRHGQRDLAAGVYRAQQRGQHLLAQAPTGIGKTLATLFGGLRAAPAQGLDKLFYLSAKTTGRALALDALTRLGAGPDGPDGLPLRVMERVARDKACEHPDRACHGESCPLARGFFDRLPAAREAAARARWLDKTALRDTALAHGICPYYLGQEMQRWSDVLVGDYNHFFDLSAHWWALTVEQGWRVALLVDEAHNLIDRARQMHSATLDGGAFSALRQSAPAALKKPLTNLQRRWSALARDHAGSEAVVLDELPREWLAALHTACAAIMSFVGPPQVQQHPLGVPDSPLQRWALEALHFLRVADHFDTHTLCELGPPPRGGHGRSRPLPAVSLRNLVPGPLLAPRWEGAHSATLFSATLTPMDHVADLLGLPAETPRLDLPSPFAADQLRVRIAPWISTRFHDRATSLDALVSVIAAQCAERPGNYLAFFSSFDYLQQALERLQQRQPGLPVWVQARGMDEAARDQFIARFVDGGQGVGFAVLGGAFGEGIDLPGERLVGAFIATLGMPQVNRANEQMRQRLQARSGQGHDQTYLYPGLMKVVQAAGRVIRSERDRGTLWLLDDRFARAEVRRLLPGWWRVEVATAPADPPAISPV